eukprot:CAMPEP_0119264114 /NCGR_PEP_ID=MMETSP1329-20130426/3294_1 /TAXON_ID=114041 /ORGANISM="Genus nov. species nov., Strain RCC1024" /LENGTH=267 /DNA_ID=CAMNT_0007263857 /DNA_START=138 /DNA_END=937 /DNA_ORIENTATION=-
MWLLLCLPSCAALTLVRHRAALHRAPMATPKALPAWRDPSALRHRVQARASARQPTMVFGLSRVFGWLKTSDFMWTGVLVFFLLKRLKQVAEDPTVGEMEDDEDAAEVRGNKIFKGLSGANYNFVAQTEEDLLKLRTMTCKKCGFTIYIAKNRLKRHFTKGLCCLSCGAVAPDFYNENDPLDPINKAGATIEVCEEYEPDPVAVNAAKAALEAAEAAPAAEFYEETGVESVLPPVEAEEAPEPPVLVQAGVVAPEVAEPAPEAPELR